MQRLFNLFWMGLLLLSGCQTMMSSSSKWQSKVDLTIPMYGHRNWIVIADQAYPAQSRSGIQTIYTDSDQISTVKTVLDMLAKSTHVKPKIMTDMELDFVSEKNAPGITTYRNELKKLLGDTNISKEPHENIIKKLDEAGATFRVLILKTNMTLPYTSVFLELDCAYWSAEKEAELRDAIKKANTK